MDFITKHDTDTSLTESLYGRDSNQMKVHQIMLSVEKQLQETGSIAFGKECKNEYIVQVYRINIFDKNRVNRKTKYYLEKDSHQIRNEKTRKVKRSVREFIVYDALELILNGYDIVDFNVAS